MASQEATTSLESENLDLDSNNESDDEFRILPTRLSSSSSKRSKLERYLSEDPLLGKVIVPYIFNLLILIIYI